MLPSGDSFEEYLTEMLNFNIPLYRRNPSNREKVAPRRSLIYVTSRMWLASVLISIKDVQFTFALAGHNAFSELSWGFA